MPLLTEPGANWIPNYKYVAPNGAADFSKMLHPYSIIFELMGGADSSFTKIFDAAVG